jgi:hypothetical protein
MADSCTPEPAAFAAVRLSPAVIRPQSASVGVYSRAGNLLDQVHVRDVSLVSLEEAVVSLGYLPHGDAVCGVLDHGSWFAGVAAGDGSATSVCSVTPIPAGFTAVATYPVRAADQAAATPSNDTSISAAASPAS